MPVQKICTVAEAVRLNEYAYALTLEVGEEMAAQTSCGQFVHIKCGEERLLRRPISICSWLLFTGAFIFPFLMSQSSRGVVQGDRPKMAATSLPPTV